MEKPNAKPTRPFRQDSSLVVLVVVWWFLVRFRIDRNSGEPLSQPLQTTKHGVVRVTRLKKPRKI